MKHRNLLPWKFLQNKRQRGQAIIEFVLLLAVMSLVTYGFVYFMNKNLRRYWEYSANLIINDRPGVTTETIR
jgi:Tfp pilus assembly protein PilW